MKFIITILFVFLLTANANIKIQLNKINSLFVFTEAIMGKKNRPISYKNIYEEKYKNDLFMQKRLKELKKLYKIIKSSKIYNYPKTNKLYSALIIESTFVNSLLELEQKIVNNYSSSIDKENLKKYFEELKIFLPIFEELIWNKHYPKLKKIQYDLNQRIIKLNELNVLKKVFNFYNIESLYNNFFYINLYPVPNGKRFRASRYENTAHAGVILRKRKLNLDWFLSAVILHEVSHNLYSINKKTILKIINKSKFNDKKHFLKVLDEGLQTSISAGFIYNKLTGKFSKGKWYNNYEYNSFAKAIYSDVAFYLDNNKKLDEIFIQKSIKFYKQLKVKNENSLK